MLNMLTALAIKAISGLIYHTLLKVDRWTKRWLTTVHAAALTALFAGVIALDWALATGNAIPVAGAVISALDIWLGPIDEIALAAWPTYRVCYEVAVRWVRWFERKGLELPKGLKEFAAELETEGDKAHQAVAEKVVNRAKPRPTTS